MDDSIQTMIVDFISEKSQIPAAELTPETEVYESNLISSLSLLELITLIETHCSVVVEPEELTEENFKYIHTIVGFIKAKVAG